MAFASRMRISVSAVGCTTSVGMRTNGMVSAVAAADESPDHVDAGHALSLGDAIALDPGGCVGARLRPGSPPVALVVHVERRLDREGLVLVGDRGVDGREQEHALAGMRGEGDERVALRVPG